MAYLLMILTGLLMIIPLTFPQFYILAWFAFIPAIFAVKRMNFKQTFIGGWLLGTVLLLGTGYGLSYPILFYSSLPRELGLVLIFFMYLLPGIYYGLWGLVFKSLQNKNICHPTILALTWTAFEFIRYKFIRLYPFGFLGYSQSNFKFLLQFADIGGVLLISFIVVLINGYLFKVFIDRRQKAIVFLLILFLVILGYGGWKINHFKTADYRKLKTGIVFTSISQSDKWDTSKIDRNMKLLHMNLEELTGVDLAVTPETSLTFDLKRNEYYREKFLKQIDSLNIYVQAGSQALNKKDGNKYNSSFLISPKGEIVDRYNKNKLVIGEYLPFENRIKQLYPGLKFKSLNHGSSLNHFQTDFARWKTVICSEILYPMFQDEEISQSQFIVNPTNEAWFNHSNIHQQLWSAAIVRAVETRKSLIRSGNMAFSGVIKPSGRASLVKKLGKSGSIITGIPLSKNKTVYQGWRDFIGLFSLIIVAIAVSFKIYFWFIADRNTESEQIQETEQSPPGPQSGPAEKNSSKE